MPGVHELGHNVDHATKDGRQIGRVHQVLLLLERHEVQDEAELLGARSPNLPSHHHHQHQYHQHQYTTSNPIENNMQKRNIIAALKRNSTTTKSTIDRWEDLLLSMEYSVSKIL